MVDSECSGSGQRRMSIIVVKAVVSKVLRLFHLTELKWKQCFELPEWGCNTCSLRSRHSTTHPLSSLQDLLKLKAQALIWKKKKKKMETIPDFFFHLYWDIKQILKLQVSSEVISIQHFIKSSSDEKCSLSNIYINRWQS